MRDDLNERLSLNKRFQKLMSLGIWSDNIPEPDPQTLERIERLNTEIQNQIFELYLPESSREQRIKEYKQELYQEYQQRKQQKIRSQEEKSVSTGYTFVGTNVSSWMRDYDEDTNQLKKYNLPSLSTVDDLANLVNTNPDRLIWLFYHEDITQQIHYEDFTIPKGKGYRKISKPCPVINQIQQLIKNEILDKLRFPNYINGFIQGKNIYDNAREHTNCRSIVTIDIAKFFGNITFYMVRKSFNRLGYSGQISTLLALITTKQEYSKVEIAGQSYWDCSKYRHLPQGACTSPGVSNLIAQPFDKQLYHRSKELNFKYTRYADDLTFSTTKENANHRAILYLARKTLELHGFKANPTKTKILFPHNQQQVTGLNLNSGKPTVPREWRRNLRAAVHQFRFIEDPEEKEKEYERITGCLQHLKLSHPRKAKQYKIEIDRFYQLT